MSDPQPPVLISTEAIQARVQELAEQISMVLGEDDGPAQLALVGREKHLERLPREGGAVEAEAAEHHAEALVSGDLAVRLAPDALGLLPAPEERAHEVAELEPGGERSEGLVEMACRRAHGLAVGVDLGQPGAIEEHQGVEQVEAHGLARHGRGLRWA